MENTQKKLFTRWLDAIERAGNKLPDPVVIFAVLCLVILLVSAVAGLSGLSAVNPATGETVYATNLLNKEGIARIISEAVKNFAAFPPVAMVLVAMIGIGVAEKSGWFEALMKSAVETAPKYAIVPVIIFTGIMGNAAGDAGPIVLPPIAAMVFMRLGYHPVAGLICAYASCVGAFAANLTIGMTDVLALAFTEPAAHLIDKTVELNVAMNYYFIAVSTFLLLFISWIVTMKITIPRLGKYVPEGNLNLADSDTSLNPQEKRALRCANISALIFMAILVLLALPEGALLRNAETGSLINKSPLMDGIIFIVTFLFFVPGLVYAVMTGRVTKSGDVARMMTESMAAMANFIVIVFFAAQMLAYFNWSNLGVITAIKGAEALAGQSGIVLILGIICMSMLVNMLIGSSSAKWAILAPIFVPMLMLLGYHPAFTQMLYRIGDSITNPITPMLPYMPLLLSFAQRYVKNIGMGTLIAGLMPYTIAFGIAWALMMIAWYLIGWPLGPGGHIYLTTP